MSRALQNEILVCASLHGLGTLFFLSAVSFSTRRSQSVKLGYVCSLCHARSESLGNRTLFSLPFPPVLLFFSSFLYFFILFLFFSLHPLPSAPLPSPTISSHPFATGEIGFFHCTATSWHENTRDTGSQVEATFFSKQEPRLYSRGMQVHRLIAKEEQFVDPSPALNCFPFFAESFTRYTVCRPGFLRISRLKIAHANGRALYVYIYISSFVRYQDRKRQRVLEIAHFLAHCV